VKPEEPAVTPEAPKPPEKAPAPKPKEKEPDLFGQNQNGWRTWTDSSGQYQVEARFVSVQDSTVRLQKADGRYVRIAMDKLCSADQQFVGLQNQALAAAQ